VRLLMVKERPSAEGRAAKRAQVERRRSPMVDAIMMALFYASLASCVFFGARVLNAFADTEVYGYHLTDAARTATKRELDKMFAALIPDNADRRAFWNAAVAREIEAGDLSAARGFILAAPAMLPKEEAETLKASLPEGYGDEELVDAAAALLDTTTRENWAKESSLMGTAMRGAGDFVSGAITGRGTNAGTLAGAVTADFFVIGDIRDLTIQSGNWVSGQDVDVFILSISAVGLGLTAATIASAGSSAPVKAGASVLKAGKRAGKLSVRFLKQMSERVARAIPPRRLKAELNAALGPGTPMLKRPAEAAASFRRAADPAAVRRLTADLDDLGAASKAVSPSGTLRMLEHVDDAADLRRMRLVAESGGDRVMALIKRSGKGFLRAAKATLKITRALAIDLSALISSVVGFIGSVLLSIVRMTAKGMVKKEKKRARKEKLAAA
jgi:hypothetical protein